MDPHHICKMPGSPPRTAVITSIKEQSIQADREIQATHKTFQAHWFYLSTIASLSSREQQVAPVVREESRPSRD